MTIEEGLQQASEELSEGVSSTRDLASKLLEAGCTVRNQGRRDSGVLECPLLLWYESRLRMMGLLEDRQYVAIHVRHVAVYPGNNSSVRLDLWQEMFRQEFDAGSFPELRS